MEFNHTTYTNTHKMYRRFASSLMGTCAGMGQIRNYRLKPNSRPKSRPQPSSTAKAQDAKEPWYASGLFLIVGFVAVFYSNDIRDYFYREQDRKYELTERMIKAKFPTEPTSVVTKEHQ